MTEIVAKHVVGLRVTHNRDGRYTRSWRLWSDGRVERTNSRSKYQPYLATETVPEPILRAAEAANISIHPGRVLSAAAIMGSATSARKSAAARENGKLGGRPSKT